MRDAGHHRRNNDIHVNGHFENGFRHGVTVGFQRRYDSENGQGSQLIGLCSNQFTHALGMIITQNEYPIPFSYLR